MVQSPSRPQREGVTMVQTTEQLSHMALPEEDRGRNVYDVLMERGFVAQVSDEAGLRAALERPPVTLYCGYDPTATSLHIGNLLTIMALAHFQRHGHRPIALLGGGTGMIGDPTDRLSQRDRKSTRLNSSHANISYAVFCLKKKTKV